MRTLFIGVLAANLVGCAAHIDSKPVVDAQNARSTKSKKPQARSSNHGKRTKAVAQGTKQPVARKTARTRNDKVDPVAKAKARIAAMMANPASAEFSRLERAVKNNLNRSDDTICGYVRGKNASGEDIGPMPFLYIIRHDDRDDEAYLVHGKSLVAETVHGALCK